MGKKMLVSWTVVCVVIAVAVGYLSASYPYVRNIKAVPVAIQGNTVTIKGSVDIYFTDRAWEEIAIKAALLTVLIDIGSHKRETNFLI